MSCLPPIARDRFDYLYGKLCWGVKPGYGSCLTLEFGEPHLEIREPRKLPASRSLRMRKSHARRMVTLQGEWHLWIYCCEWRVSSGGKYVGGSSLRRVREAARELDGQALIRVEADLRRGRWLFDFDLGGRLETRPWVRPGPHEEGPYEQWLLYEPSGYVLTVREDGTYSYQPGDTLPHEERWVPLEDST